MAAPTIPYTIPGTVNQDFPEMVCRISFQGATQADPLTWVDFSSRLRSFSIEQGSENELDTIDPGQATVVLDNRIRDLDPFNTSSAYSPNVKPRRRLWLQSQWAGETKDQFYGWTGSFQPGWVANTDAVVTVEAQDGLSVLSRSNLPVTDPPRDTYADVVLFDQPYIYLPCNEALGAVSVGDASGNGRSANAQAAPYGTVSFKNPGLLIGDAETCLKADSGVCRFDFDAGTGDISNAASVAMDGWVNTFTGGASGTIGLIGPSTTNASPSDFQYGLFALNSGPPGIARAVLNTTSAKYVLDSAALLAVGTTYHLAMRWDGANLYLYIDGVQVATTAATGTILGLDGVTPALFSVHQGYAQHFSVYPALSAARVQAHYTAGRARGLDIGAVTARLEGILDNAIGYRYIPRRIRSDATTIQQTYFHGQDARSEIDRTLPVAGDPSMLFLAKDGAVVFLDSGHRSVSPWDTVQATFDDDGTDLKYLDVSPDDGMQFIHNNVRGSVRPVTQTGVLVSSSDPTSIADYGTVDLDLGETLHQVEADLTTEVAALLAKYKDPIPRVTEITLHGSHNSGQVATQIFNRELGDKVRVFRRPMGGGSAIDQSSWIRKRTVSGDAHDRWPRATWALSSRGN